MPAARDDWTSREDRARDLTATFRAEYWLPVQCAVLDEMTADGWSLVGLCGPLDAAMVVVERGGYERRILRDGTTVEVVPV